MPRKSPCNQVNPKKLAWLAKRASEQRIERQRQEVERKIDRLRDEQHTMSELGMAGSKPWQATTAELLKARTEQLELLDLCRALEIV